MLITPQEPQVQGMYENLSAGGDGRGAPRWGDEARADTAGLAAMAGMPISVTTADRLAGSSLPHERQYCPSLLCRATESTKHDAISFMTRMFQCTCFRCVDVSMRGHLCGYGRPGASARTLPPAKVQVGLYWPQHPGSPLAPC